jgi:hypothetical protein
MKRLLLWGLAAIVVLAVASQFALPPIAEHAASDRLTSGGGSADVELSAFPAARLLFGDGDRIAVTGSRLDLSASGVESGALEDLDGFDQVAISLRNSTVGPVTLRGLSLTRDGAGPYSLRSIAYTSPADLVAFGAGKLGPLAASALRFGAGQALGSSADDRIPIHLHMRLIDDGGRIVVVGGSGSVAGVPTGPLAELVTTAVAVRL